MKIVLTPQLASKVASIIVHADEMLSPKGHAYDAEALRQLLADPQVVAWIKELGPLVPVKR